MFILHFDLFNAEFGHPRPSLKPVFCIFLYCENRIRTRKNPDTSMIKFEFSELKKIRLEKNYVNRSKSLHRPWLG